MQKIAESTIFANLLAKLKHRVVQLWVMRHSAVSTIFANNLAKLKPFSKIFRTLSLIGTISLLKTICGGLGDFYFITMG
jgi:hypothetical protein